MMVRAPLTVTEVGAALLLGVVVTVVASLLLYAYARGIRWWRSQHPSRPPIAEEQWEWSSRESDGGRAA